MVLFARKGYPFSSTRGRFDTMRISDPMPIGGTDYPTTWVQFLDWFHSEHACRDYLEKLRWADGLDLPEMWRV